MSSSFYCRSWSKSRAILHAKLEDLYKTDGVPVKAQVSPSGLNAIYTVLSSLLMSDAGDNFLVLKGDEMYEGTMKVLTYLKNLHPRRFGWLVADIRDQDAILDYFRNPNTAPKVFIFESCTNPSGQMLNFQVLKVIQQLSPNCIFVCDNSYLGPTRFNPFLHDVDIVIDSMTKFMSGCSCIGGSIVSQERHAPIIQLSIQSQGLFVGSDHCDLFVRELEQLSNRVQRSAALAHSIAEWMENDVSGIYRVHYSLLKSSPTYDIAAVYLTQGGPSCIWFFVGNSSSQIKKMIKRMKGLNNINYITSYGGPDTRIDPWPKKGGNKDYELRHPSHSITCDNLSGMWFRLAVGYDSTEDEIKNDILKMLY